MINHLSGIQSIHAHNRYNHIQHYGYGSSLIDEITPELPYDDTLEVNKYKDLKPGLYKVKIKDVYYAFLNHHQFIGGDELIIKNAKNVYSIIGLIPHVIQLYEYDVLFQSVSGSYKLDKPVNGSMDILALEGFTDQSYTSDALTNTNSRFISRNSLHFVITDEDYDDRDVSLNLKVNLNSIESTQSTYGIYDVAYIDSTQDMCLINHKVEMVPLTGQEHFELADDDRKFVVLYYNENMKSHGRIITSHLHRGNLSIEDGVLRITLKKDTFTDLDAFRSYLGYLVQIGYPFTIIYELVRERWQRILLDSYKINLTEKDTNIMIDDPDNKFFMAYKSLRR